MSTPFKGRIDVDIRDSVPDWAPFLQPKAPPGAPNVLMIVWDDVGYGAMDVFGGPIETPTMRRIADAGSPQTSRIRAFTRRPDPRGRPRRLGRPHRSR